jgi:hypothetical protein
LNTDPQNTTATWTENWSQYFSAISLSGKEEMINDGSPDAIFNLIKDEIDAATETLKEEMAADLFANGAGNGGKDMTGFLKAIDDGTTYPTYAGVNRLTYVNWKAKRYANGGVARAVTYKLLKRARTAASFKNEKPGLGVTTNVLVDRVAELMQPNQQFSDSGQGSFGFDNILFERKPVFGDDNCPAGTLYWFSEKDLKMVVHPRRNFSLEDFAKPVNQDAKVAFILWMGQLYIRSCRNQAVIVDLSEDL